jgi:hypothetical protein
MLHWLQTHRVDLEVQDVLIICHVNCLVKAETRREMKHEAPA